MSANSLLIYLSSPREEGINIIVNMLLLFSYIKDCEVPMWIFKHFRKTKTRIISQLISLLCTAENFKTFLLHSKDIWTIYSFYIKRDKTYMIVRQFKV